VVARERVMSERLARYAQWMDVALIEARAAGERGDIPIGAVVVDGDAQVLSVTSNRREVDSDPTAHAEILALRAAAQRRGDWRLADCTLLVTVEPCPMCAGAAVLARISTLVIGTWNEQYGAAGSHWDLVRDRRLNHQIEVVSGVRTQECSHILREFLWDRRGEDDDAPYSGTR
jgi:tRNA(adenine34) deaminase